MKKLIKMYNEKYGNTLGIIDDDFNKEQMYRIYYFIKNNCEDKEIQDRIKMINLDKPKTLEQQLTKLESENNKGGTVDPTIKTDIANVKGEVNKLNAQYKDIAKQTMTEEERTKLTNLENYNDTTVKTNIQNVQQQVNNLVLGAVGDGNNAEVVQARGGFNLLNNRLASNEKLLYNNNVSLYDLYNTVNVSNNLWTNGDIYYTYDTTGLWKYKDFEVNGFEVGEEYTILVTNVENHQFDKYVIETLDENSKTIHEIEQIYDKVQGNVKFRFIPTTAKCIVRFQFVYDKAPATSGIASYRGIIIRKTKVDIIKADCIEKAYPLYDLKYISDLIDFPKYLLQAKELTYSYTGGTWKNNRQEIACKPNTKYTVQFNEVIGNKLDKGKDLVIADFRDSSLNQIGNNVTVITVGETHGSFTTPEGTSTVYLMFGASLDTPFDENFTVKWTNVFMYEGNYVNNRGVMLNKKMIPNLVDNPESSYKEDFKLLLPSDIYVAIGYPLEIYNKYICYCGNINNFHFKWSLDSGKNMGRKLVINPSESKNGTTEPLKVEVYDNNLDIIDSATSTVHYVKPNSSLNPSSNKNILCIGDSLTDIDKWRTELLTRLNTDVGSNFSYIGNLGSTPYKHEGHSGWSINSYLIDSSEGWNGNYKVKVEDNIGDITPKKQYKFDNKIFEFEKKSVEDGVTWLYFNRIDGSGYVSENGTAIEVTSSVSGASSIPYTNIAVTSKNPFFNTTTNSFDANYYSDNLGTIPDYCIIWLGANSIIKTTNKDDNLTQTLNNVNKLKTIIDNILTCWNNCKIFVCYNHYWAPQSGLGNASGTDCFDKSVELGIFNINNLIKDKFENYNDRLVLIPIGQTHDSEHNYPYKEVAVNTHNSTEKVIEYTDRVHPNVNTGFIQFADVIYGTFINNL